MLFIVAVTLLRQFFYSVGLCFYVSDNNNFSVVAVNHYSIAVLDF